MSDFLVNHTNYGDTNNQLAVAVKQMGKIIDDLESFLARTNDAVQGQAAPLWHEQQVQWRGNYAEMQQKLGRVVTASYEVANTFHDGDRRSASIF
ncbi:WXG100 family type VII secretion target [Saccharopolyspora hattusasensis]|uniref:WXG100 family type VII secretion target n=1 Tax=Saccharopolyspora hattusasensis TaxID=1128679 RepID=UPI003D96FDC6